VENFKEMDATNMIIQSLYQRTDNAELIIKAIMTKLQLNNEEATKVFGKYLETVAQQQEQKTGDTLAKNQNQQKSMEASAAPKTVEQLAMDEAKKFGRSTPNAQDKQAAAMAYRKQALGGKSEGDLSGVSTLPTSTPSNLSTTQATPTTQTPQEQPSLNKQDKTVEQLAMEEAKKFGRSTPNYQDQRAAEMAFRKQALGGKSEGDLSGVSTLPASKADDVANKTASLKDQEAAATKTEQPAAAPIINNTNVVSNQNNAATKPKDTKNNESTFQKYMDRRYYPV
jgi:hypothetical protein